MLKCQMLHGEADKNTWSGDFIICSEMTYAQFKVSFASMILMAKFLISNSLLSVICYQNLLPQYVFNVLLIQALPLRMFIPIISCFKSDGRFRLKYFFDQKLESTQRLLVLTIVQILTHV